MSKIYPVGLVGESNYQVAIRRCSEGQGAKVVVEIDNPYDELALAVVSEKGETLGYIARDSWLRDAIHEQGLGCEAVIKTIGVGETGLYGVVLDVSLNDDDIMERDYAR